MKKNRILLLLTTVLLCTGIKAQNLPKTVTLQVKNFSYKEPSAGKSFFNLFASITDPTSMYSDDSSLVPEVNRNLPSVASFIPWITLFNDQDGTPDYRLEGIITTAELNTGIDSNCYIKAKVSIIDGKTGKKIATKSCRGNNLDLFVTDMGKLRANTIADLMTQIYKFVMQAIPVTGNIQKALNNNQYLVSMGEAHGLTPGLPLYIIEDGKYKAELKVKEITGSESCICKISNGQSYVEKCLQNGTPLVVTTKSKKIKDD